MLRRMHLPACGIALLLFTLLAIAGRAGAARLELVTSVSLTGAKSRQVTFDGDYAWVAQNFDGATLLNIADPAAPQVVHHYPGEVMQPLYLQALPDENLLISADRFQGLVIYDVARRDVPTTVSQLALPGVTLQFALTTLPGGRRLALLARGGDGVDSVDITEPASAVVIDSFTTGVDFTREIAVKDGIAYVADNLAGGLKALRITPDGHLEPLYQVRLFGACDNARIAGGRLAVGYRTHGFRLFDFPAEPDVTATTPTLTLRSTCFLNRSFVKALCGIGPYIAVANNELGVALFDAHNPDQPWLADEFRFEDANLLAQWCCEYRNTLYVPAWEAGLLIFRVTDEPTRQSFNLENLD